VRQAQTNRAAFASLLAIEPTQARRHADGTQTEKSEGKKVVKRRATRKRRNAKAKKRSRAACR